MGALMKAGMDSVKSFTREEILSLRAIMEAKKFKVSVGDDWRDDHLPCCDFTISAKNFKSVSFSLWWIDARVMGWAEACEDSPKIRAKFKKYMASSIKDALEDVED